MTEAEIFESLLRERCGGFIDLDAEAVQSLWLHFSLMRKWNRKVNLTSVIELEQAVVKHYAESLFLATLLPEGIVRLADIGSGAGFPGIPIAVTRPNAEVVLVESDQRKAAFLRECRDFVGNARVLCGLAEALEDPFDAVVGRAVRPEVIVATASRVANSVGILLSRGDGEQMVERFGGRLTPLPWDPESVAFISMVPRETSKP